MSFLIESRKKSVIVADAIKKGLSYYRFHSREITLSQGNEERHVFSRNCSFSAFSLLETRKVSFSHRKITINAKLCQFPRQLPHSQSKPPKNSHSKTK